MAHRLKIYLEPTAEQATLSLNKVANDKISLPLCEVLPMLADALNSDRTWLRDFDDDQITISTDLYEMILAYQHFCRPSA